MNVFSFGDDDEEGEVGSRLSPREVAGYFWAEDEFQDVVLVHINEHEDEVTIKNLDKKGKYHRPEDITLIEKVDLPDDYDSMDDDTPDAEAFTRWKLRMLYGGILAAFAISITLPFVLPEYILAKVGDAELNMTFITNVVIMMITIGIWKWKLFTMEKVGPTINSLSDTMDKFEEAGFTAQRLKDYEPIMVAIAEGVGSMDEDEINDAAKAIRQFFNNIGNLGSEGLDIDGDASKELEEWKENNVKGE